MRRLIILAGVLCALLLPAALAAQTSSPLDPEALPVLINARTDLELLANQLLGAQRPVGWTGSLDINDVQLPIKTRLDLELLAGTVLAPDQRPPGWFGAVPSTAYAIARDIRHDLELLADFTGTPGVRPVGWAGDDPLMRCDRGVQALVTLLERGGLFALDVNVNDPNFCQLAEVQASRFAEQNLLANPGGVPAILPAPADGEAVESGAPAAVPGSVRIESSFAVAYLNRFATERVGVIPPGTTVTPVARSFAPFSRMTLVRGEDFEVFIDYRESSLTDEQFAVLPDIDTVPVNAICNAEWCEPTIFTLGNLAAGRSVSGSGGTGAGGRVKVPVEHLIILYDGQDNNNTTVVRMQLCAQPVGSSTNTCQAVEEVLAPDGTPLEPVGTLNGLSQFRLPYGYSAHTLRADSYFMTDVWIAALGQGR